MNLLPEMSGTLPSKHAMRGLAVFISDIRACSTKDEEEKRINKEMAHIRKKFKEQTSNKLDGYNRKKYVCKILYMYLLGYEPDFGYMEVVRLLSGKRFSEKQIGYVTLSVVLHEDHELIPLVINSFRNDLESRSEYNICLALAAVCNIGGKGMAESLAPNVEKILISPTSVPMVKKKAAMCLLRLYKKYPELVTPEIWVDRISEMLANETELGAISAYMCFLHWLTKTYMDKFAVMRKKGLDVLSRVVIGRKYSKEYIYYKVGNPWLQVRLMQYLQLFQPGTEIESGEEKALLHDILSKVIAGVDNPATAQTPNHKNAYNAVFFEAVNLIIHMKSDLQLLTQVAHILGKFLTEKISNLRYLALEAMTKLANISPEASEMLQQHQQTVTQALQDPDISIRKRALDLLYGMCDRRNCTLIVGELLKYLHNLNVNISSDFAIREELVLKVAILAEKYAPRYKWYVDVMLQLVTLAGDAMSDEIWYRAIKIITNHEDIQQYAAITAYNACKEETANETTVKVAGYLLGEYGRLITDHASGEQQLEALQSRFKTVGDTTKAILLSTYIKFIRAFPSLAGKIIPIFKLHSTQIDNEIQQRAVEYLGLASLGDKKLIDNVCDVMPPFGTGDDVEQYGDDEVITNTSGGGSSSGGSLINTGMEQPPPKPQQQATNVQRRNSQAPSPSGGSNVTSPRTPATIGSNGSGINLTKKSTKDDPLGASDEDSSGGGGGSSGDEIDDDQFVRQQQQNAQQQATSPTTGGGGSGKKKGSGKKTGTKKGKKGGAKKTGFGDDVNKEFINAVDLAKGGNSSGNNGGPSSDNSSNNSSTNDLASLASDQFVGSEEERAKEKFKKLTLLYQGALYEDDYIQIGFKSEYQQGQGRFMLYFGNKTKEIFNSFTTIIPPAGFLNIVPAQPPPPIIDPSTQQKQLLQLLCQSPFTPDTYPQVTVSFMSAGKSFRQKLDLPITINKFIDPVQVDAEKFKSMFLQNNQPPMAHVEIFPALYPINITNIEKLLTVGFRLQVIQGVESQPQLNLSCCGAFNAVSIGRIPVLVRLETNPQQQMIKISIKTSNAAVTAAVRKLFLMHMAKPQQSQQSQSPPTQ